MLTPPLEVNLQLTDVADEEQLFAFQMKKKSQNRKWSLGKRVANNAR